MNELLVLYYPIIFTLLIGLSLNKAYSQDKILITKDAIVPNVFISADYQHDKIVVNLDFSALNYKLDIHGDSIFSISALPFTLNQNIGELQLPNKLIKIQIPNNYIQSSLKFSTQIIENSIIKSNVGLYFVQAYSKSNLDPGNDGGILARNSSLVKSNTIFPSSPVLVKNVYKMGNGNFVDISVSPFQFLTIDRRLIINNLVTFIISFEFDQISQPIYNNYQVPVKKVNILKNRNVSTSDSTFLIITANHIVTNSKYLNEFEEAKRKIGFNVKVITENDYGNLIGQYPNEIADRIKKWLIDNVERQNIKYILLIGNPDPQDPMDKNDFAGDVPMKMLFPRVGDGYYWNDFNSPSDAYYSDIYGNWDLDGDGLYGEYISADSPRSPDPSINDNNFSIRWTGQLNVKDNSGMRLALYFGGGIRLWIDDLEGTPVVNKWFDNVAGNAFYDIISPGLHNIKIEYFKGETNGFLRVLTGNIGASWYNTLSLNDFYFLDNGRYRQGGLYGEYYNDKSLIKKIFARNDTIQSFDFRWLSGDRGEGGINLDSTIPVGRIPVYNKDYLALDNILQKTIGYEDAEYVCWRNKILLPMKPFDNDTKSYQLGEEIVNNICKEEQFDFLRIYDDKYDLISSPEMMPCTEDNVIYAFTSVRLRFFYTL